jgi:hypothetical protein
LFLLDRSVVSRSVYGRTADTDLSCSLRSRESRSVNGGAANSKRGLSLRSLGETRSGVNGVVDFFLVVWLVTSSITTFGLI